MEECNYAVPEPCGQLKSVGETSSIQGSLERKKQALERNLSDVNSALDAMKANPEIAKLLELVNKAR